ncbi:DivIVA domain-containing protein [Mumia sp. ZJ430]|uniref:DivIVA domain-containing protein n=1 Tax=Mumia sp. ZJ430 TaxID=2708083 RepID=UPI001FBAAF22|nr:DivIVA domain-containing protein [Mumia sp. ZJ430]
MIWIGVLVGALIVGAAVTVVAGRTGALGPPVSTRRDVLVPAEGELTARDLRAVRFTRAWRGYARDEVDALLARLEADVDARAAAADEAPRTADETGERDE